MTYLIVTDHCGYFTKLTGNSGIISSPRWPLSRDNRDCKWKIEVGDRKNIKIAFMDLHLEDDCRHFFVEIRGGRINVFVLLTLIAERSRDMTLLWNDQSNLSLLEMTLYSEIKWKFHIHCGFCGKEILELHIIGKGLTREIDSWDYVPLLHPLNGANHFKAGIMVAVFIHFFHHNFTWRKLKQTSQGLLIYRGKG